MCISEIFDLFFFFLGFLKLFDVFCRKIFVNFDPFLVNFDPFLLF